MKILITKRIPQKGIQLLEEVGHTLTIHSETTALTKAELIKLAKQHHAVLSVGGKSIRF
ncbi:hypothetical protein ACHMWN_05715 [Pedobacter sp. UC225_61]|uniref:hypothetical protein n=1 Tax=Pedobacter sp. UC225_61 TaxID=3374623 RepID=UPI0037AB13ED